MNEVQRAGLVMHELIYREGILVKHKTSFPTRYFNGYLATAEPKAETYASIILKLPFDWTEMNGMMIEYAPIGGRPSKVYENGNIDAYVVNFFADVLMPNFSIINGSFNYPEHLTYLKLIHDGLNFTIDGAHASWTADSLKVSSEKYNLQFNLTGIHFMRSLVIRNIIDSPNSFRIFIDKGNLEPIMMNEHANSWLITKNSQYISNIRTLKFQSDSYVKEIITASGERWIWDGNKLD